MSVLEQLARSRRFSGQYSCILTELEDGFFSLHSWGGAGELLIITDDPEVILATMKARPEYKFHEEKEVPKGLLSKLRIEL